jgi:hypothetical protein
MLSGFERLNRGVYARFDSIMPPKKEIEKRKNGINVTGKWRAERLTC